MWLSRCKLSSTTQQARKRQHHSRRRELKCCYADEIGDRKPGSDPEKSKGISRFEEQKHPDHAPAIASRDSGAKLESQLRIEKGKGEQCSGRT